MPPELTWDDPANFYDSGITWDETSPTPTPQLSPLMNTYKVIVNYSDNTNSSLSVTAQTCYQAMNAAATTFVSPPITMVDFLAKITIYDQKLVARQSRSLQDVAALRLAREEMLLILRSLANYVNAVADGRLEVLLLAGLPFYNTRNGPLPNPPPAPTNLRLRQGIAPGSIVARFKPAKSNAPNQVEVNLGDPNVASQWEARGTFPNGIARLSGFASGIVVRVRVRTLGPSSEPGAWSSEADIRTP